MCLCACCVQFAAKLEAELGVGNGPCTWQTKMKDNDGKMVQALNHNSNSWEGMFGVVSFLSSLVSKVFTSQLVPWGTLLIGRVNMEEISDDAVKKLLGNIRVPPMMRPSELIMLLAGTIDLTWRALAQGLDITPLYIAPGSTKGVDVVALLNGCQLLMEHKKDCSYEDSYFRCALAAIIQSISAVPGGEDVPLDGALGGLSKRDACRELFQAFEAAHLLKYKEHVNPWDPTDDKDILSKAYKPDKEKSKGGMS